MTNEDVILNALKSTTKLYQDLSWKLGAAIARGTRCQSTIMYPLSLAA